MKLFFVDIKVKWFNALEALRVFVRYQRDFSFLLTDFLLGLFYLGHNPYRLYRRFAQKWGEDPYTFGHTPLTTLDRIAREAGILERDHVVDIGCGTGRTSFWLHHFVRCRVTALDILPTFIEKAERVRHLRRLKEISFEKRDMLTFDYSQATVLYLYGTSLPDETLHKLMHRFEELKRGARVISVSYPLTDYSDAFVVTKEFEGRYPWGTATLYINSKS